MSVARLSATDFTFRMGLQRAAPRSYFASPGPAALAERQRTLREAPEASFGWSARAPAAVVALGVQLRQEGLGELAPGDPQRQFTTLATSLEPDLLLLDGRSQEVVALAVTAPSGWAPQHALGRSVSELHAVVPGLETQLGTRVRTFLDRLGAGDAYERSNWGLTRSDVADRHPRHALPPLDASSELETVYLRVEHQLLWGLGEAVLFAIRVVSTPLTQLGSADRAGLARQLRTMPEEVARYKGLGPDRRRLIASLE